MEIKCRDIASAVIEEATSRFSPLWVVGEEKYSCFNKYCDIFDVIVKEFDAESLEVKVNEEKMTIVVSVECIDVNIDGNNNSLCDLIGIASSTSFSKVKDGDLRVSFVFPGVWDRA